MLTALALVLLSAEPASLTAARAHLKEGKVDEVLFDLQGQNLPDANKAAAADVLAQAAAKSLSANDDLMALQLAQMALRHQPKSASANETAARASLKQQQFESAEKYADSWLLLSKSADARLFRAELAVDQADWDNAVALLAPEELTNFSGKQFADAEKLRAKAQAERDERLGAMTQVKGLEAAMATAATEAKALDLQAKPAEAKVIVYSAAWCGYCKKTKAWLKDRKIDFVEKDIEKDKDAATELAQKAAAANVRPGGVPVIDYKGTLVLGFDEKKLAALAGAAK